MSTACVLAAGALAMTELVQAEPANAAATTLYVSPTGSDSVCSVTAPCSVTGAKTLVRSMVGSMTGDIAVQIADGTYRFTSPLDFTAADSGTGGHTVRWEAAPLARPVFTGAQKVTGWTVADSSKNIYKASVGTGFDTRQLYVDGVIATRARTQLTRSDLTASSTGLSFTNSSLAYLNTLPNQSRIEIHGVGSFTDRYSPVSTIAGNTLTMQQPAWNNNTFGYDTIVNPYRQGPLYIENSYSFLDAPGEWYLDTTAGDLFYKPLAGQSIVSTNVELPRLPHLLAVGGTLSAPAHNISFSGLQFSGTSWLGPSSAQGFADQQTGAYLQGNNSAPADALTTCQSGCTQFEATRNSWNQMPGAVQVSAANSISFVRNSFINLGSTALGIGNDANAHASGVGLGTSDISVVGSVFTQNSAGGIVAGGLRTDAHHPSDSRMLNQNLTISNNLIHDVGIDYRGITSFLPTYVTNAVISHNEIYNMPYSGVAFGYGWGTNDVGGSADYLNRGLYNYQPVYSTPTTAKGNRITDNYIHNTMQSMNDGACIYTLSANPNAVISGNHCVDTNSYYGLYFDEGSRDITTTKNVFSATGKFAHANYQGGNNTGALTLTDNWSVNGGSDVKNGEKGNTVGGNITVSTGAWPTGAKTVIDAAGLEPAYRDIKASTVTAPYTTYSSTPASIRQWGGQFALSAAGTDAFKNAAGAFDQYATAFTAQSATSGSTVTARVDSLTNTDPWSKAGVVLRNSLTGSGSSPGYAAMVVTPGNGFSLQADTNGDGYLDSFTTTAPPAAGPVWVRLVRNGDTVTGFYSTNGTTFTNAGTVTLPGIATTQDAGVFYTAHSSTVGRALFSDVTVINSGATFSSVPAAVRQAAGTVSVTAAGSDTWGAGGQHADEYGSWFRPGSAASTSTVTTRVDSSTATNPWAKAGLMVRSSITGSQVAGGYVVLAQTPTNGVALQWDGNGDGFLESVARAPGVSGPVFLRLVRSGSSFVGSYSMNGTSWTTVGTANPGGTPTGSMDAGVFVTSHDAAKPATAVFSGFTIS